MRPRRFWRSTVRNDGGANNPLGLGGKGGKVSEDIVTFDNIQGDIKEGRAPTGTSAQAGIRRLEKAAESGDGNAGNHSRRASDTPLSTQAIGQLRLLWRTLAARSASLDAAAARVPKDMLRGLRHKGPVGRERALSRILQAIPAKPFRQEFRTVLWRDLVPEHDSIRVDLLSVGFGTGRFHRQSFGIAYSHHALGRLLDRSAFAENPMTAMLAAHDCLLGLTPDEGYRTFELKTLTLPTSRGAFLVTPRAPATDDECPFAMAKTWISTNQTGDDQDAEIAVWRKLTSSDAATINKHRG